jgi:hypothetical protein
MLQRFGYALILIAALTVCGCKKGPLVTVAKKPFEVPQGWKAFENHGIHIAAPYNWAWGTTDTPEVVAPQGDPTNPDGQMAQMAAEAEKENEARGRADAQELEKDGILISAMNKSYRFVPGELRTHFNVKKITVGGNAQMQDVIEKMNDDCTGEGPPEMIDTPLGKIAKIKGKFTNRDGGVVTRVFFGFVNGSDMYEVRFVTEDANYDIEKDGTAIVQTMRID